MASDKLFITSMLLDEVQLLLFDFATSITSGAYSLLAYVCPPQETPLLELNANPF
ncbi:MAG TPA: hypothetical protein VEL31_05240 [Ktedonobacteraceae bacterium]|nr:hypothetical protein [Ktedonobacteraceae bacterium]